VIRPFELQDFNLYYISRYGFRPSKVAFLAKYAWTGKYSLDAIKRWLGVFLYRFFELSQFKRSCLPNGPKVGSGGSLSPRSDWRAPADAKADVWLRELAENVPDA
jgi:NAD+ synthase (glutamine-hydrolysing)